VGIDVAGPELYELRFLSIGKKAPEIAAEDYEVSMTRPGGYAKDAQFDLRGFENVLKLRAEVEGQWGGHPPAVDKYYDPSYYTAALAKATHTP
jgi:hypothetical protein